MEPTLKGRRTAVMASDRCSTAGTNLSGKSRVCAKEAVPEAPPSTSRQKKWARIRWVHSLVSSRGQPPAQPAKADPPQ